jgi:hypothetical protein
MTYDVGNPVLAWDRHKNVAGLNQLMGPWPSPFDNWISNSNIYIYNIRTLSVNIKFICTSFRNRQNNEPFRPVFAASRTGFPASYVIVFLCSVS